MNVTRLACVVWLNAIFQHSHADNVAGSLQHESVSANQDNFSNTAVYVRCSHSTTQHYYYSTFAAICPGLQMSMPMPLQHVMCLGPGSALIIVLPACMLQRVVGRHVPACTSLNVPAFKRQLTA